MNTNLDNVITRPGQVLQRPPERNHCNRNLKKSVLLVALTALSGVIIKNAIESRSACQTWNGELMPLEKESYQANRTAQGLEKRYRELARENCKFDFDQSTPFVKRDEVILEFCEFGGHVYPKNKIPLRLGKLTFCENSEGGNSLDIRCVAKRAIQAQAHFEQVQHRLSDKISQKPLFCSRGR